MVEKRKTLSENQKSRKEKASGGRNSQLAHQQGLHLDFLFSAFLCWYRLSTAFSVNIYIILTVVKLFFYLFTSLTADSPLVNPENILQSSVPLI